MKKLLLSALAVCAFTFSNAQETEKSSGLDVTFGAKAGLNLATLAGDAENVSMKPGFHVGGMAEIAFNEKFSVQPEVMYSLQGAKVDGGFDGEFNLSYINLPVMAKYYVAEGFSIEAGPQVGFLIDAKSKADGESFDEKEFTSSIDFGVNFGAGYKLDNGLNFSARYNVGLANTYDGPGKDDNHVTNAVMQLSVGYFFN